MGALRAHVGRRGTASRIALALRGAIEKVMLPSLEAVQKEIPALARAHAGDAHACAHARAAGDADDLRQGNERARQAPRAPVDTLKNSTILVKRGGPTGNYNARRWWLSSKRSGLASRGDLVESFNAEGAERSTLSYCC